MAGEKTSENPNAFLRVLDPTPQGFDDWKRFDMTDQKSCPERKVVTKHELMTS